MCSEKRGLAVDITTIVNGGRYNYMVYGIYRVYGRYMVYGRYNELVVMGVIMVYKPTFTSLGGPSCTNRGLSQFTKHLLFIG